MAEIEIEKKKTMWPWILLGVIILLVILYFLFFTDDDVEEIETDQVTTEQVMEESDNTQEISAVAEYGDYIDDPNMGLDHEYANGAILELIAAVEAVARENNVDIQADIAEARSKAQMITEDPMKVTHADRIKSSGETIARAMHKIQTEKYPNLEEDYSEVESALSNIEQGQETLNQKEAVKSFFDKADELLTEMK